MTRLRQLPPPRSTPLQRSLREADSIGSMVAAGGEIWIGIWLKAESPGPGGVTVIETRAVAPPTRATVARQNEHMGGSPGGAARPQRRPPAITPTQRPGRVRVGSPVMVRPA